jgi:hypothetical protein
MEKKITPSDLRKQAEALIAEGRMPSLDEVLQAVFETRCKYTPQILAARARAGCAVPRGKDFADDRNY